MGTNRRHREARTWSFGDEITNHPFADLGLSIERCGLGESPKFSEVL